MTGLDVARLVEAQRRAQGLEARVTDALALRSIAALAGKRMASVANVGTATEAGEVSDGPNIGPS